MVPVGVDVVRIDGGFGAEVLAVAVRVVDAVVRVGVRALAALGLAGHSVQLPLARLRLHAERWRVRQRVVQPTGEGSVVYEQSSLKTSDCR